jgi:hypothetical protein
MKTCFKCQIAKPLDLFGKDKRQKDGKFYYCKDCSKVRSITNNNKLRATKEGRAAHSQSSLCSQKNSPTGQYAKLKNDPLFKFAFNMRSLVGHSIKKQGYSKKAKTAAILGCDFEFFQLYMEMQFKPGMTWDNHGEWHIDHKTPISWAKTEEEVIKLNHFTNLQPLWAVENIQKGNRYAS